MAVDPNEYDVRELRTIAEVENWSTSDGPGAGERGAKADEPAADAGVADPPDSPEDAEPSTDDDGADHSPWMVVPSEDHEATTNPRESDRTRPTGRSDSGGDHGTDDSGSPLTSALTPAGDGTGTDPDRAGTPAHDSERIAWDESTGEPSADTQAEIAAAMTETRRGGTRQIAVDAATDPTAGDEPESEPEPEDISGAVPPEEQATIDRDGVPGETERTSGVESDSA